MNVRDRRRAAAVQEIKKVAMDQVATAGPQSLSLRAVARELGMTVQALYHYFDSRDALVTALVTDAHQALADAVADAARLCEGQPTHSRMIEVGLAYRAWAVHNRAAFLLIYGIHVPDYVAPEDGPTSAAATGIAKVFRSVVFDGWSADQLGSVPLPPGAASLDPRLRAAAQIVAPDLPPGALALFITAWAQLHGVVMLELLNHVPWVGDDGAVLCRIALTHLADHLEAVRSQG
jgi:AcrR family transcriptional regulator